MASLDERLRHLERRQSDAARWSRHLAVFAIPFLAIVVAGHRLGLIETQPTFWLLGLAVVILTAAFVLGVRGFYELWTYGSEAGLNALRGVSLAALLLLPFAWFAYQAVVLPALHDVSTDLESPPEFDAAEGDRGEGMNPVVLPPIQARDKQLLAYPQVAARRYPLGSSRVFRAVLDLVTERDWTLLTAEVAQGNAPIDDEDSGLLAKPIAGPDGLPARPPVPKFRPAVTPSSTELAGSIETQAVSPVGREADASETLEERYIEAVARSLLFGFESDVVIRLVEEEDGTLVDMRSSSRWGPHDLGSNAARITGFMADLDTALQGQEG